MKLAVHFKFKGGIEAVMKDHFERVFTSRPHNYGNRPNRGVFDPDGEAKLRSGVDSGLLNIEDPVILQKLCSVGLSTNIMLRGGKEIFNKPSDRGFV